MGSLRRLQLFISSINAYRLGDAAHLIFWFAAGIKKCLFFTGLLQAYRYFAIG